ncbi:MAG: hypothetical protein IPN53_24100 [Comamonadaceae bacterium]|nr:hypothetical protein [Comamonadaceae bacterium]
MFENDALWRPIQRSYQGFLLAIEGNSPGLLSKVAKSVLNPTVDWEEKAESERSGDHGKLALKQ